MKNIVKICVLSFALGVSVFANNNSAVADEANLNTDATDLTLSENNDQFLFGLIGKAIDFGKSLLGIKKTDCKAFEAAGLTPSVKKEDCGGDKTCEDQVKEYLKNCVK